MPANCIKLKEAFPDIKLRANFDFLGYEKEKLYDRIIANPPFNKGQDVTHFRKMYDHLKPNGVVVSIMSLSWVSGSIKKFKEFREWLDDENHIETEGKGWRLFENIGTDTQFQRSNGDTVFMELVDAGEFKESGTNVRTIIVVIEKNN